MPFKTINTQKLPFFVALALATVLTSCGSFQYVGYDNDGIYSSSEYENSVEEDVVTTSTNESNYYKNYFAENSAEVDAIKQESEIFTDIDSYEGNYVDNTQNTQEEQPAYGGWGQENNTVTINYIDNGWMGWNDPWMWNGGMIGWNNWGWNNGWNNPWGWNRWGWNRWGWNNGWNNPWGWNRWGINNWGWNNGWGWGNQWNNGFRNGNQFAFTNSRRGSLLYNNNLNRRSNSALSNRNRSTSRLSNRTTTRQTGNTRLRSTGTPSRSIGNSRTTRATRSNTRVTRPSTRTTRPSTSRSIRNTRTTSPSTRTSSPSRSTRSSTRSSSPSVRSSGSSRTSSGSSRSSGGRRGRG